MLSPCLSLWSPQAIRYGILLPRNRMHEIRAHLSTNGKHKEWIMTCVYIDDDIMHTKDLDHRRDFDTNERHENEEYE